VPDAFDLLPRDLLGRIPPLGATDGQGGDAVAWVKLFHPASSWTWYITETDGSICYGLVVGHEVELGYFSLSELAQVRPIRIERDMDFQPTPLRELPECPSWLREQQHPRTG